MTQNSPYFSFIPKIMALHGLYPLEHQTSVYTKMIVTFVWIYSVIQQIVSATLCCVFVYKLEDPLENIAELSFCILCILIYVTCLFHFIYHTAYKQWVKEFREYVNGNFRFESDDNGTGEKTSMAFSLKFGNIFSYQWQLSSNFSIVFMALNRLLVSDRGLLVPAWLPYNWKKSPYYELTFILQALSQWNLTFIFPSYDLLYFHCAVNAISQFKILETNVRNVVYIALLKHGISPKTVDKFRKQFNACSSEDDEDCAHIYSLFKNENFNETLMKTFGSYIDQYQMIFEFCAKVKSFYSPLLLVRVLFTTGALCFVGFCTLWVENISSMIALMLHLYWSLFTDLLMTTLGTMLSNSGEKILDALYETPWFLCNLKFKKTFLMLQTRIWNAPVKLTAGNLFDIDLTLYINILKTSGSYYTILRQVTER